MKYSVTIAGRTYEFKQMRFKRMASLESQTCELLIQPARGSILPVFNDAIIITKEIQNVKLIKWQGKVNSIQQIPLTDGTIKIIGYDHNRKSKYLKVANLGYSNSKGSTILSSEIAPNSVTDLTPGSISTSDAVLDTVNFGKGINGQPDSAISRDSAMTLVAQMSDRDVYIHKDGTVDFSGTSGAGIDRTATHIFEDGINGKILPDVGYSEDEIRRVKQVIVKGYGVGSTYIIGSAGTPTTTDKVRQIDMPHIQSAALASTIAQSILSELDQTTKYTKFELIDLFSVDYDVYDSITLKARFPTKTINQSMKIYSIETVVSNGLSNIHEVVTIELQNFRRSIWAPMANQVQVAQFQSMTDKLSLGTISSLQNLIPSIVTETQSLVTGTDVDTTETYIEDLVWGTNLTMGLYAILSLEILTLQDSSSGVLDLQFNDGTNFFPTATNRAKIVFNPFVGEITRANVTFFISKDVKGADITLKAHVEGGGKVNVIVRDLYYTVGV